MKKLMLAALPLAMLFACKKDNVAEKSTKPAATGETKKVTISASNFLAKFTAARKKTGAANGRTTTDVSGSGVTDLYFYVEEDAQYQLPAKFIHQHVGDPDFGTFSTDVHYGQVIAAVTATTYNTSPDGTALYPTVDGNPYSVSSPYGEIFLDRKTVNVDASSAGTWDMHLTRPGEFVEVNIMDAPTGDSMAVTLRNETSLFMLDGSGASYNGTVQVNMSRLSLGNYANFIYAPTDPMYVAIYYWDRITGETKTKLVEVPRQSNTKVTLTGSIYQVPVTPGGSGNNGFSISIDTTWNDPLHVDF